MRPLPLALVAAAACTATAFQPYQNPRWPATWALNASTLTMTQNSSGILNATFVGQFGVSSIDWSNEKALWAAAKPMDCEERLVSAAQSIKNEGGQHVFVYRNLVKALPWYTSVREKIADPAYAGWFLRFKPGGYFPNGTYHVPNCDTTYNPPLCSPFYHDQEQTPEVPSPSNPNPDGSCVGNCDCGGIPCGEYLWDHRNASLRSWLVAEHVMGPTGLGHPDIDGLFIDDFWCSNILNGSCTDPVQGPTEVNRYSAQDMGLSDSDILAITQGWLQTMTAAQEAILTAKKYTWSLIPGQSNANASPKTISAGSSCTSFLREACAANSPWVNAPLLFGITPATSGSPTPFAHLGADIAAFQLARGPYAYIGWGVWGVTWPGIYGSDKGTPLPLPAELSADYGIPTGSCGETTPNSGIFVRRWSKATVQLNCATLETTTQWA